MTRRAVGTAQRIWAWPFDAVPSDWTLVASGTLTETIAAFGVRHVYQAAGYAFRTYPLNVKFEPSWLYRIRCRARRTATSDATKQHIYVGVAGVADDGITLVNTTGQDSNFSQHYIAVSGADAATWPLNEWREVVGYFRGWSPAPGGAFPDPLNPGGLHPNARYFRPLFAVNYDTGPAGNVMQLGDFVVEAVFGTSVDSTIPFGQVPEFVHLIEANYSGGSLYLNTGARDLYWNGRMWDAIGGLLSFDAVQESGEDRGRGVAFQLSGVDQTIIATLLTNNYRGRIVRVYRAYLDPVSGQVIDPDARGIRIGASAVRYAHRNPVATWPTGDFTVEYWGRLDSGLSYTQDNWGFSYGAPASTFNTILFGLLANTTDWRLRAWVKDTAGATDPVAYPDDHLWHHLALTWVSSSGLASIYLDGVLRFTATISSGALTGGGAVVLGQDQDSLDGGFDATQAWKGELDRVRVYTRVLTASEIAEHFRGTILDKTSLVAEWSFDDPGNMGRDSSPNTGTPNDLTIVGIPIPSEGSPITKVLLLFEGLQVAPYEIEENRDRSGGGVVIKMQAIGYLGVEKIRGIDANVTSHQHIYSGETFFQNVASLANLHVYWGTHLPTPIYPPGGGSGGGYAGGGGGGGGPRGKT